MFNNATLFNKMNKSFINILKLKINSTWQSLHFIEYVIIQRSTFGDRKSDRNRWKLSRGFTSRIPMHTDHKSTGDKKLASAEWCQTHFIYSFYECRLKEISLRLLDRAHTYNENHEKHGNIKRHGTRNRKKNHKISDAPFY